jgi:hypothetical protein
MILSTLLISMLPEHVFFKHVITCVLCLLKGKATNTLMSVNSGQFP